MPGRENGVKLLQYSSVLFYIGQRRPLYISFWNTSVGYFLFMKALRTWLPDFSK